MSNSLLLSLHASPSLLYIFNFIKLMNPYVEFGIHLSHISYEQESLKCQVILAAGVTAS